MQLSTLALITKERIEQLTKHGRTVALDVEQNKDGQLRQAAIRLLDGQRHVQDCYEFGWDRTIWKKMIAKTYDERLVIAAALLAAERDRFIHPLTK